MQNHFCSYNYMNIQLFSHRFSAQGHLFSGQGHLFIDGAPVASTSTLSSHRSSGQGRPLERWTLSSQKQLFLLLFPNTLLLHSFLLLTNTAKHLKSQLTSTSKHNFHMNLITTSYFHHSIL